MCPSKKILKEHCKYFLILIVCVAWIILFMAGVICIYLGGTCIQNEEYDLCFERNKAIIMIIVGLFLDIIVLSTCLIYCCYKSHSNHHHGYITI